MHQQRIVMVIVAALGALGTFLPWVQIPLFGSVNGTGGDGWISFVLFGLIIALCLSGKRENPLGTWMLVPTFLFAVAAVALGVWKIVDVKSVLKGTGSGGELEGMLGSMFSVGIGLYVIIAAGLAVMVSAIVLGKKAPRAKA